MYMCNQYHTVICRQWEDWRDSPRWQRAICVWIPVVVVHPPKSGWDRRLHQVTMHSLELMFHLYKPIGEGLKVSLYSSYPSWMKHQSTAMLDYHLNTDSNTSLSNEMSETVRDLHIMIELIELKLAYSTGSHSDVTSQFYKWINDERFTKGWSQCRTCHTNSKWLSCTSFNLVQLYILKWTYK